MDIRRTILLMIFSLSLLMLWNNWQVHQGQQPLFGVKPAASTAKDDPAAGQAKPNAGVPSSPAVAGASASANAAVPANAPAAAAQTVSIKTDVLRLTFDLQGAQLVEAELLKFPSSDDKGTPELLLQRNKDRTYIVQSGLTGAPAEAPFPSHLAAFTMVSDALELTGDTLAVKFASEAGGVRLIKTFTLHRGSYAIEVEHHIENLSAQPVSPFVYLQITRDSFDPAAASTLPAIFTGPAAFVGAAIYSEQDKFQKVTFTDIEKHKSKYINQADNGWFAMVQHYFVTAWVPPQGKNRNYEVAELGKNLFAVRSLEPVGAINPGSNVAIHSKLWVGPQDQNSLEALAPGLELVVDYGMLTIIAKPLFALMTWLHALLGNWGWTIIALTCLIKAAFYPLSAASYRSMAKMKQVGPRMQALKEKFGDDRQKLNAAMMEMYRTEKINPLGGCLPIVVQIPVFISLYYVLLSSVELRDAPWIFWVQDLATRDPYFILPAIMMATMFLQMKLNPTPPDPVQAKVMMFMPLVFGGMMFFFPSGLVLYWCVNNILSIAQQWYITQKMAAVAATPHR